MTFSRSRTQRWRFPRLILIIGLIALLLGVPIQVRAQATPVSAASAMMNGDVMGLVDIGGGRKMYLMCRGAGGPTVILEAGAGNNADTWDALALGPDSEQTAVLPGVAAFTRVCAYDRPGTMLDPDRRSRSDPAPMPRGATEMVADLHALLRAANVPGPYVLAGHSFGGLVARLYAATYPDEVAGLVLVDAAHEDYYEQLRALLTPEQWTAFTAPPPELVDDPVLERLDIDASTSAMREAAAATPLRPLPLVVLTHGRPFDWPSGVPAAEVEALWLPLQEDLAALVPDGRLVVAERSEHFIQGDQPELVIAAIRQVVDAVRDPGTPALATPGGAFTGPVDIGGRSLYLECRGQGSPTVILEAGALGRGDVWTRDLREPEGTRTMVLPGVAKFTRVCTYDRPGTLGEVNPALEPDGPLFYPGRSDPVPQPRTAQDMVADLHALLRAANVPGPYVLVAHSAGGLVARLYASTYPAEVVGMVLVDATHEDVWLRFQAALTPAQWAEFETLTVTNRELQDAYPEAERLWTAPLLDDATTRQVRQARADAPLRPMPLLVLAHGIPFAAPIPGWPTDEMEAIMLALQDDLARLVPNARRVIATESGHDIHQDQPELVIDAVRQVVEAVRDPGSWELPTKGTPAP